MASPTYGPFDSPVGARQVGDVGVSAERFRALTLADEVALDTLLDAEHLAADVLAEAERRAHAMVSEARRAAGGVVADLPPRRRAVAAADATTVGGPALPRPFWVPRPAPTDADAGDAPRRPSVPAPSTPPRPEQASRPSPPSLPSCSDQDFRVAIYRAVVGLEPLDPSLCGATDIAAKASGRAAEIRAAARRAAERAAAERLAIQAEALARLGPRRAPTPATEPGPDGQADAGGGTRPTRQSPWVKPPAEHYPAIR